MQKKKKKKKKPQPAGSENTAIPQFEIKIPEIPHKKWSNNTNTNVSLCW